MQSLEISFLSFINTHSLFKKEHKLLLALSGGKDSVALFHLLLNAGYYFEAAHCNFQLRANESEADQRFCEDLCKKYNVILHSRKFETEKYAQQQHQSTQVAARELRYAYFAEIKKERDLDCVLTAHHLQDKTESLLYHFAKGLGTKSLVGIPLQNAYATRPLLGFTQSEILAYLKSSGYTWIEDRSNATDKYSRNKIRHQVLPALETINPGLYKTMQHNFWRLENLEAMYQKNFQFFKSDIESNKGFVSHKLTELPGFGLLFEDYGLDYGFSMTQIQDILKSKTKGAKICSETHIIYKENDGWQISQNENLEEAYPFKFDQKKFGLLSIDAELIDHSTLKSENLRDPNKAFLGIEEIPNDWQIRTWQKGDYFFPFGGIGRKLISDFLNDIKLSSAQKNQQKVLAKNQEVIWVIGHRISENFKPKDPGHKVLKLVLI
jgi:tRNA(Ile)-lysidine synthase